MNYTIRPFGYEGRMATRPIAHLTVSTVVVVVVISERLGAKSNEALQAKDPPPTRTPNDVLSMTSNLLFLTAS